MKILQINTADRGGGAAETTWNLYKSFEQMGHESWLAVGSKRSGDPAVIEIPKERNQPSWSLPLWKIHGHLEPLQDRYPAARRWRENIHSLVEKWLEFQLDSGKEIFEFAGSRHILDLLPSRPDIIHAHNLHTNYFDLRFIAPLSRQVPLVLHLHDMWMLTGHCAHSYGCDRWKTGCGNCPDLSIYPSIRRDATAYNWRRKKRIYRDGSFYVTAPSAWLIDLAKDSILPGIEYRVVHNGIDTSIFHEGDQSYARQRLGLPESGTIVLFTSHNKFKDYEMMVSALSLVHKVENGEDLFFVCLGRKGVDQPLGEGTMLSPGMIRDPQEMALYYQAADVYTHAARGETFARTIIEAMACGLPVVANRVGGISEIIEDGFDGFLVLPKGVQEMAERIQSLLDREDLRRRTGEHARQKARQHFPLERQAGEYLSWFGEILERRQSLLY